MLNIPFTSCNVPSCSAEVQVEVQVEGQVEGKSEWEVEEVEVNGSDGACCSDAAAAGRHNAPSSEATVARDCCSICSELRRGCSCAQQKQNATGERASKARAARWLLLLRRATLTGGREARSPSRGAEECPACSETENARASEHD